MGTLLIEINETLTSRDHLPINICSLEELKENHEVKAQLRFIAEQQRMLAA